jgi:hypothetical protein
MRSVVSRALLLASIAVFASCGTPETFPVTPRQEGDRTPLTAACSPFDADRCIVPWPSNTFTVPDASTATGLRLSVDITPINAHDTGATRLSEADGFSRVSSLAVEFDGTLDPASFGGPRGGVIRLFVATPTSPRYGEEVPLRIETYADRGLADSRCTLIADPLEVLEPQTDYVAVVTDDLHAASGPAPTADPMTQVALGLVPPHSPDEARLAGYYAPILDVLHDAGIAPAHVVRAWDFTTRSIANASAPIDAMVAAAVAAIEGGHVTIAWDVVEHQAPGGPIASILEGRLVGLPTWLDASGALVTDANGIPTPQGTGDAPFRVMIPSGTGDYRAVLYGHGAGGNFHDASFDDTFAMHGTAKVGVQFDGWTDTDLVVTLSRLVNLLDGAHRAFAPLMQAVANALAVSRALDGLLDDALSAPMLNGMPNPNAGRHVDWSQPTWVGGSLGGTMGLVVSALSDDIHVAVLNVPGAAWSHWVFQSAIFQTFLSGIAGRNGGTANVVALIAMAQTLFDPVDGATFGERSRTGHDVYLEQESIGDDVLPNPGNEFVAIVTGATQVGVPLHPILGLSDADHVTGATGMTQFQVGDTGIYDVHGFAARDTPAGRAAFEQIQHFLDTAWAGSAEIVVPTGCGASGCVFPASP